MEESIREMRFSLRCVSGRIQITMASQSQVNYTRYHHSTFLPSVSSTKNQDKLTSTAISSAFAPRSMINEALTLGDGRGTFSLSLDRNHGCLLLRLKNNCCAKLGQRSRDLDPNRAMASSHTSLGAVSKTPTSYFRKALRSPTQSLSRLERHANDAARRTAQANTLASSSERYRHRTSRNYRCGINILTREE